MLPRERKQQQQQQQQQRKRNARNFAILTTFMFEHKMHVFTLFTTLLLVWNYDARISQLSSTKHFILAFFLIYAMHFQAN